MKALSSLILGIGLSVSATVVAADAPAGQAPKAAPPAHGAQKGPNSGHKAAVAPAAPAAPTVALEADGVSFGMSADDVAKLYDRWWDKQFVSKYQRANPGPKTRELDFELAEKKKVLRRVAVFDGRTTSFDKADFHEEFAHGSSETMTSAKVSRRPAAEAKDLIEAKEPKDVKSTSYTRRFFFFQDKLWKVYDEYHLEAAGLFGADFKEATARIEATLGKGAKKTRGPESQYENVVFDAGTSRVRVVKLSADRVAVVRSDNALAKEVLDRRAQQAKTADSAELDDDIQAVIR